MQFPLAGDMQNRPDAAALETPPRRPLEAEVRQGLLCSGVVAHCSSHKPTGRAPVANYCSLTSDDGIMRHRPSRPGGAFGSAGCTAV
jgi:hypothetical protein